MYEKLSLEAKNRHSMSVKVTFSIRKRKVICFEMSFGFLDLKCLALVNSSADEKSSENECRTYVH